MLNRRPILSALAMAAAFVAWAVLALTLLSPAMAAVPQSPCQEDQPCFSWSTMGNLERGVVVRDSKRAIHVGRKHPNGRRLHRIVTACQFAYLSHEGLIDRKRTPRLRGDKWAEVHGCDYDYYG